MRLGRNLVLTVSTLGALLHGGASLAAEGVPRPWEWWHQPPATPIMENIDAFHYFVFWVMVGICGLVVALLAYVLIRFNARRNPTPSRTAHNTAIEVIWTIVPVLILVVIAIPSFQLLYYAGTTPDAEMTLKATGRQWFWEYQYPDHGGFTITSLIVPDEELEPGQPRLLAVDNRVVLPVDTTVRIQITAGDVLHSWAVPTFGIKVDAVPGRLNETWARIDREGIYYGQCSEICGVGHAYMPIAVEAVSKEAFAEWVERAQAEFAGTAPPGHGPAQQAPVQQAPVQQAKHAASSGREATR